MARGVRAGSGSDRGGREPARCFSTGSWRAPDAWASGRERQAWFALEPGLSLSQGLMMPEATRKEPPPFGQGVVPSDPTKTSTVNGTGSPSVIESAVKVKVNRVIPSMIWLNECASGIVTGDPVTEMNPRLLVVRNTRHWLVSG